MNEATASPPSNTLPHSLQELEAALGPELAEITHRHRAELARRAPYRPVVATVPVVTPPMFCIRAASGRARRPGTRRASSMASARSSGSDDDGGGESDPVAVAVATPSNSPTSPAIEHNARRLPGCAFQETA